MMEAKVVICVEEFFGTQSWVSKNKPKGSKDTYEETWGGAYVFEVRGEREAMLKFYEKAKRVFDNVRFVEGEALRLEDEAEALRIKAMAEDMAGENDYRWGVMWRFY